VPFLDRSGVKIYYEDHGHGPAILLSHGYGAICRMWDEQIAAFAPHYRIIVWDMRGHGETDDPEDPATYSEALTVAQDRAGGHRRSLARRLHVARLPARLS
jgi:pimeloyl-ACP methyl ester carboxylesterase